jgi:hypothetical protein
MNNSEHKLNYFVHIKFHINPIEKHIDSHGCQNKDLSWKVKGLVGEK